MDHDLLVMIKEHPESFLRLMGFGRRCDIYGVWMREMMFGRDDYTLQAFRGSGKTTCLSAALALKIILYPNRKMAFFRKTDTDVKEVIAQVQKMLVAPETQAICMQIWGVTCKLVATQSAVMTNLTNDPRGAAQLTGMGIGGSITGKHFDEIFTDDIVNLKDRTSRAERERTKAFYMELQNIKNRGGRIMNTGTPWHIDDCFSIMPEAHKWDYRSIPEAISVDEADEIRGRMTPSLFAANYELRHIPSDDVIFTHPQTGAHISMVMQGQCHVDAAYYGEDYTAFTVMNKHDGKYYVYGRIWRKHVEDVTSLIVEENNRLLLSRMYMETNSDKGYAAKTFRNHGIKVQTYAENLNKYVKIVTYLKTAWPDIVFCEGTDQLYIDQICDYTEDAEHDDAPDSLASLVQRAKFAKAYVSPFG
jgi:predicted phage terminase large subunit-like protein